MKALILLGGDAPSMDQTNAFASWADMVIGIDKGAELCLRYNIPLHHLVGDMDSVDSDVFQELLHRKVKHWRYPAEKDETDGQLGTNIAMALGCQTCVLLGGFGGRMDHFLGNVSLLCHFAERNINAVMVHQGQSMQVLTPNQYEYTAKIGDVFSFWPLPQATIASSHGLYYPYSNTTWNNSQTLGISNQAISTKVGIQLEQGLLVMVRNSDEEWNPQTLLP